MVYLFSVKRHINDTTKAETNARVALQRIPVNVQRIPMDGWMEGWMDAMDG